jgi:hypothetical protein
MSVGALQKASLAAVVWFILFLATQAAIQEAVWPPERRIAAIREGHYPIDVPPPLPMIGSIAVYVIPTVVVGLLVIVYRRGTSR